MHKHTIIAPHWAPQARIESVSRTVGKLDFHDSENATKTKRYSISSSEARPGAVVEFTVESLLPPLPACTGIEPDVAGGIES